jgi:hypothetical protein
MVAFLAFLRQQGTPHACIPAVVKADDLLTAFLSLERDAIALKANVKSNQT